MNKTYPIDIPNCPDCGRGTVRRCLGSFTTLLGWTPTYDAEGKLMNSDPNVTTTDYLCVECNGRYEVRTKGGEVI